MRRKSMGKVGDCLCNPFFFGSDTEGGVAEARVKRGLAGLILAVGIAVGIYFATMAVYGVWNPFGFSPTTQMALAITCSVVVGLINLCVTGCLMAAVTKEEKNKDADKNNGGNGPVDQLKHYEKV
jgi:hypothetical protein